MVNLFSSPVKDQSGEGLEKVFFHWEAVQFYLYSKGITRETFVNGKKCLDVSVYDHFSLEKNKYCTSCNYFGFRPPDKELLGNYFISWQSKKFCAGELDDHFNLKELDTDNLYKMPRQQGNTNGFDILTFIKKRDSDDKFMLPIEAKYSSSTSKTKFSVADVTKKLRTMGEYELPFPFMVFVVAREVAIPNPSNNFEHG